jgi:hypothetical protein
MVDIPRPGPSEITAALAKQSSTRDQGPQQGQQNFRALGETRDLTGSQGFRTLGHTTHTPETSPVDQTGDERTVIEKTGSSGSEVSERKLPPGHPVITTRNLDDLRGPTEKRVRLRKSVRRGRADIPRTPYQILDPRQSFESFQEMIDAQAEGRKRAIDDTKEERNTLIAFATEDIWAITGGHRRELMRRGSHSGVGAIRMNESREVTERIPLSRRDRRGYSADQLRRQTQHMVTASMSQWLGERVNETPYRTPDEALTVDGRNYRRLTELTGIINSSNATESGFTPLSPEVVLRGGAETAAASIWGLYDVITPVYRAQYETAPTKKDYDELFDSANDIATSFAAGHLTISIGMLGHITDQEETARRHDGSRPLKISDFTIQEELVQGDGDKLVTRKKLAIKDEAFAEYEALLNNAVANSSPDNPALRRVDEKTTGCPALAADGTGPITVEESESTEVVQRVVTEMGEWSKAVAKEHLDVYLEAA